MKNENDIDEETREARRFAEGHMEEKFRAHVLHAYKRIAAAHREVERALVREDPKRERTNLDLVAASLMQTTTLNDLDDTLRALQRGLNPYPFLVAMLLNVPEPADYQNEDFKVTAKQLHRALEERIGRALLAVGEIESTLNKAEDVQTLVDAFRKAFKDDPEGKKEAP